MNDLSDVEALVRRRTVYRNTPTGGAWVPRPRSISVELYEMKGRGEVADFPRFKHREHPVGVAPKKPG